MTTINNTTTQKNVTTVRLFVLFVFLMLSSTGVFAQNTTPAVQTPVSNETTVISAENGVASMEFAIWFMGVKKTTNENNASFSKKALINSGINTNNVLIRSFLKKVNSQESSVA